MTPAPPPVGNSVLWRDLTFLPCSAPVFENSSKIVIVMEYASRGDLYDYISERQRLSEQDARHFFRQIVSAVHYCHQVSDLLPVLQGWFEPERFHDPSRIPQGDRNRGKIPSGLWASRGMLASLADSLGSGGACVCCAVFL